MGGMLGSISPSEWRRVPLGLGICFMGVSEISTRGPDEKTQQAKCNSDGIQVIFGWSPTPAKTMIPPSIVSPSPPVAAPAGPWDVGREQRQRRLRWWQNVMIRFFQTVDFLKTALAGNTHEQLQCTKHLDIIEYGCHHQICRERNLV